MRRVQNRSYVRCQLFAEGYGYKFLRHLNHFRLNINSPTLCTRKVEFSILGMWFRYSKKKNDLTSCNSESVAQTSHSAVSDLGLYCLPITFLGYPNWNGLNGPVHILTMAKNSESLSSRVLEKILKLRLKLFSRTRLWATNMHIELLFNGWNIKPDDFSLRPVYGNRDVLAVSNEKVLSSMRKMCGFTSSCTCAKSHPDIYSPMKHFNIQWFYFWTTKVLIRLRECAGWSGPSLSAYARKHVSAWRGPYRNSILLSFSKDETLNLVFLAVSIIQWYQIWLGVFLRQCR